MANAERLQRRLLVPIQVGLLALTLDACTPPAPPPPTPTPLTREIPANIRGQLPETIARATEEAARPTPGTERKETGPRVLWQERFQRVQIKDIYGRLSETLMPPVLVVPGDNAIYTTPSGDQRFTKLDLTTGSPVWREPWDNPGIPIAIVDDKIWVLREGGERLYALSVNSGAQVTRFDFNQLPRSFVFGDGKFHWIESKQASGNLMSLYANYIVTFDPKNQTVRAQEFVQSYSPQFANEIRIQKVVNNFVVLVGTQSVFGLTVFRIVDTKNETVHEFSQGPPVLYETVTENGKLIAGLRSPTGGIILAIIDISSWSVTESPVQIKWSPFNTTSKMIFALSPKGDALIAIDPETGNAIWSNDEVVPKEILGIDDKRIYLHTGNMIAALDKNNGTKRIWKYNLKPDTSIGPAIVTANKLIFIQGREVVFIDTESGNPTNTSLALNFDPIRLHSAGRIIVVEGEKQINVIALP